MLARACSDGESDVSAITQEPASPVSSTFAWNCFLQYWMVGIGGFVLFKCGTFVCVTMVWIVGVGVLPAICLR